MDYSEFLLEIHLEFFYRTKRRFLYSRAIRPGAGCHPASQALLIYRWNLGCACGPASSIVDHVDCGAPKVCGFVQFQQSSRPEKSGAAEQEYDADNRGPERVVARIKQRLQ